MKTSGWIEFNDDTNVMEIIESFTEVLDEMDITVGVEDGRIELFTKPMMGKMTLHCVACDSQNIVEINGVNQWDVEKQDWVAADSSIGYMYECYDCGEESDEYEVSDDGIRRVHDE